MRAALIVSAVLHATLLAALLVTLPQADPFKTPAVNALPVELVTIEEVTDLTEGEVTAEEIVEDAAPETVEAEAPPVPDEMPGATEEPAETIAAVDEAVVSPEESAAPEPVGEPEPPEAEPEPEPEPRESEVAALPDPTPEPEVEPAPQEPAEVEAPTPQTVVPQRKPTPPPKRTQTARTEEAAPDAFDADRLSQLINRTDPTGGGTGAAEASLGTETGRAEATLTLSEMDALRAQMQRCWNPPIGLADRQELVIAVQISLAPDGSVVEISKIGAEGVGALYDVAADAARRAVLQCQPYRLPATKYEVWKEVQVTFDPRELF